MILNGQKPTLPFGGSKRCRVSWVGLIPQIIAVSVALNRSQVSTLFLDVDVVVVDDDTSLSSALRN